MKTLRFVAVATSVVLVAAGCSKSDEAQPSVQPPPAAATATASPATAPTGPLPGEHVHGLTRSTTSGEVLLATHDGLYAGQRDGWKKVSPTIDLMGFTAVGSTLYSSGHPGAGSDLPNPVGLLRSDDQGRTWQTQSLAGKSDFHALAAAKDLLVGYDGTLWTSHDAKTWTDGSLPGQPMSLSASLDGATVLASGQQGTWTSTDRGSSWAASTGTLPVLSGLANAHDGYGLTADTSVVASHDGGRTWAATGQKVPNAEWLAVTDRGELLVATTDGVMASTDGGKSLHTA